MAKIFPACTVSTTEKSYGRKNYERIKKFSQLDTSGDHIVVDNPGDADVILFIDYYRPLYEDIFTSDIYQRYPEKSVVYISEDYHLPLLPGIFVSLETPVWGKPPVNAVSGPYVRVADNHSLDIDQDISTSKYLYSFVGNGNNHPVRPKIIGLNDERAFLKDSSKESSIQADGTTGINRERGIFYRDIMADSKFILCPRGVGANSWRLFETMRAGRVPVVISDYWVRAPGPDWNKFALFIKEKDVKKIPDLLREKEYLAEEFAQQARKEWETWYDEAHIANTLFSHAVQVLKQSNRKPSTIKVFSQYIRPCYFRHWHLVPAKKLLRLILGKK